MKHFDPNLTPRDYNRLMILAQDADLYERIVPLLSTEHAREVAVWLSGSTQEVSDAAAQDAARIKSIFE